VGPRAGLDIMVKRKSLLQPVTILTELSWLFSVHLSIYCRYKCSVAKLTVLHISTLHRGRNYFSFYVINYSP